MSFSQSASCDLRSDRASHRRKFHTNHRRLGTTKNYFNESLPADIRSRLMENRRRSSIALGHSMDANAFDAEGNLRITGLQTSCRRDSIARVGDLGQSISEAREGAFSHYQIFTVITLSLVNFCNAICYSILAPFYPQEASSKGVSQTIIGFIFGIFEVAIFITSPIFGTYITQIGSKFLFISGIMVAGVCAILFGFLDTSPNGDIYIVMCFLVRIVQAVGCSAYVTASFAIIANTFPTRVATMFGTLETFNGLGMMVGPVIGGALYQAGGFKLPFLVMGGILLLSGIVSVVILPVQNDTRNSASSGSVLSVIKIPKVAIVAVCIVFNSCTLGFMEPTLSGHLEQFNLSTVLIGVMFLISSGLYAVTAPVWGYIGDKFGRTKSVIVLGNFGVGISYILLGPCPLIMKKSELWLVIVALVIMGLSIGAALVPVLQESLQSAMERGYPDNFETYGFISGIFASCFSLGAFIGPVGGGVMVQMLGFPWASTIVGAAVVCLGFFMVVFYILYAVCVDGGEATRLYNFEASISDDEEQSSINAQTPLLQNTVTT